MGSKAPSSTKLSPSIVVSHPPSTTDVSIVSPPPSTTDVSIVSPPPSTTDVSASSVKMETIPTTTDCAICTEKFNKSTRKCIKCEYCNFEACTECVKEFIMTQPTPICMNFANCRDSEGNQRVWTDEFMSKNFTQVWIKNTYKNKIQEQLVEAEIIKLPMAMEHLKYMKYFENCLVENKRIKMELSEIKNSIKELYQKQNELEAASVLYSRDIYNYNRFKNGEISVAELPERIQQVDNLGRLTTNTITKTPIVEEKTKFIRTCTNNDCRGYLSTRWKCGICEKYTCSNCFAFVGETMDGHLCNEADLKTAELIKRDSKPCPKCASMIHRIHGCDLMFCTICTTSFNWRTGLIMHKNIGHNPHRQEWLNRNGASTIEPQIENICQIDSNVIGEQLNLGDRLNSQIPKQVRDEINNIVKCISQFQRNYDHYVDTSSFRKLNHNVTNYENRLNILRLDYLMNYIDKDKLKKLIGKLYRERVISQKLMEVIDFYRISLSELMILMLRIVDNHLPFNERKSNTYYVDFDSTILMCELTDVVDKCVELINECNRLFISIGNTYKLTVPRIQLCSAINSRIDIYANKELLSYCAKTDDDYDELELPSKLYYTVEYGKFCNMKGFEKLPPYQPINYRNAITKGAFRYYERDVQMKPNLLQMFEQMPKLKENYELYEKTILVPLREERKKRKLEDGNKRMMSNK